MRRLPGRRLPERLPVRLEEMLTASESTRCPQIGCTWERLHPAPSPPPSFACRPSAGVGGQPGALCAVACGLHQLFRLPAGVLWLGHLPPARHTVSAGRSLAWPWYCWCHHPRSAHTVCREAALLRDWSALQGPVQYQVQRHAASVVGPAGRLPQASPADNHQRLGRPSQREDHR